MTSGDGLVTKEMNPERKTSGPAGRVTQRTAYNTQYDQIAALHTYLSGFRFLLLRTPCKVNQKYNVAN